jgi:tellurite resistance protein
MSQISYDTIRSLVVRAEQEGASMHVTFRCPVSGHEVEARAGLRAADSMGNRLVQNAKRSLMWSVRGAITGAVRRAFGHGMAGSMAASATRGAMSSAESSQRFSESDKQDAVARAFQSVSSQFVWDAPNNRFISAQVAGEVMPDFVKQLGTTPVTTPYDQGVLARMLTEIAVADGHLGDDERAFLSDFVTPDLGTVESLVQAPRLSAAELAETSRGGARDTMLMLAWGVALTDEELSPEEAARLGELAAGLGIAAGRAQELQRFAQLYLLDQALGQVYAGGQRNAEAHAEAMAMAGRLGIDPTEAERADIRFRKRHGLV